MARRTNQLNVTRLENRELMAGNVAAFVSNNVLYVREPNLASGVVSQAVSIVRTTDNSVRVSGRADQDGVPTRVNGQPFQEFQLSGPGSLSVSLAAGHDNVLVAGGEWTSIAIDVGSANPNHADVDDVSLADTRTRAGVRIATGAGPDQVSVMGVRVGDGAGSAPESLVIDTGSGADQVRLGQTGVTVLVSQGGPVGGGAGEDVPDLPVSVGTDLIVRTFRLPAEGDADTVRMENVDVGRTMRVWTGAGADTVTLSDATGGRLALVTGLGNDTVRLVGVSTGDHLSVKASAGNDSLELASVRAARLTADGGSGFDLLTEGSANSTLLSKIVDWEPPVAPLDLSPVDGPGSR